jgi:hypothetical protein
MKSGMPDCEFQLELKELELERERIAQELAEREKQRAHELAMRQLELGFKPTFTQAAAAAADRTPSFRQDVAIKLIPKFNETDVESFLLSFEKIVELNEFPRDKMLQFCRHSLQVVH